MHSIKAIGAFDAMKEERIMWRKHTISHSANLVMYLFLLVRHREDDRPAWRYTYRLVSYGFGDLRNAKQVGTMYQWYVFRGSERLDEELLQVRWMRDSTAPKTVRTLIDSTQVSSLFIIPLRNQRYSSWDAKTRYGWVWLRMYEAVCNDCQFKPSAYEQSNIG